MKKENNAKKAFELADEIVGVMIHKPDSLHEIGNLSQDLRASPENMDHAIALLVNKRCVELSGKCLRLNNVGVIFYLSGGFTGLIERDNLVRRQLETSITVNNTTRRTNITIAIFTAITCLAIIVQLCFMIFSH
jgi:ribosomal protein S1